MAMFDQKKYEDKRYFDEDKIPDDVWSVLKTSSVLNVGEFRVFQIAYKEWFGEEVDEATIEGYFTPYMFKDIVPLWVRHFCTRVLQLDSDDRLDPREFGIVARRATLEQRNRGYEFILWLLIILAALFAVGKSAAQILKLQCMFPPCY